MPDIAASIPEIQTRFIVTEVTVSGMPERSAATRVTFKESAGSIQHPYLISSIIAGSIPARLIASFMVMLAIVAAFISRNVPPKVPIAVRHADTITTSFISSSPLLQSVSVKFP